MGQHVRLSSAAKGVASHGMPRVRGPSFVSAPVRPALSSPLRGFFSTTDQARAEAQATATAASPEPTSVAASTSATSAVPTTAELLTLAPQDPWDDLRGLVVTAKLAHPRDVFDNRPFAIGRLVERISSRLYRVKLEPPKQSWHSWPSPAGSPTHAPHTSSSSPSTSPSPSTSSPSLPSSMTTPMWTTAAHEEESGAVTATSTVAGAGAQTQTPSTAVAPINSHSSIRPAAHHEPLDMSRFLNPALPLTLDIGTRVALVYDDDLTAAALSGQSSGDHLLAAMSMNMEGLVVRVNGNNTYTVLMDNGEVELSVEPGRLLLLPPGRPTSLVNSQMLLDIQAWLRSCVIDSRDCEAAALILFKRGWRLQRLFLLERNDLTGLTFIPHLQRESVVEKAQWERDYYHVLRNLKGERVKDRDYRYAISKYKGTISCLIGILVVSYVFFSNLRAYDRQQRSYQLRVAAKAIASGGLQTNLRDSANSAGGEGHDSTAQVVARPEEEEKMARVFRQLDAAHPRIVVVTGFAGNGKSALCRKVMDQEGLPAVFVYVRGGGEDTLRSIVRSLGVLNVEVCGDLMDFLSEAIREARTIRGSNVLTRTRRVPQKSSHNNNNNATTNGSTNNNNNNNNNNNGSSALTSSDVGRTTTTTTSSVSTSASASSTTATATTTSSSVTTSTASLTSTTAGSGGGSSDEGHVPLMVTAPAALGSSESTGSHTLPIIYVKLMDSSRLEKAYKEAVGLVVDHQVCHLVFEAPMESLTPQARRLARLDFYMVPNFTRPQAFKYLLNVMEPSDMAYFVEVIGTNCNDLDELYAAVRQRGVNAVTYTAQKLMKGMRRLHAAAALFAHNEEKTTSQDVLVALQKLASVPFDQGRPTKQVPEITALGNHAQFKDILLYDPLRDRWFFSQQVLHTAARCFYCAAAPEST